MGIKGNLNSLSNDKYLELPLVLFHLIGQITKFLPSESPL